MEITSVIGAGEREEEREADIEPCPFRVLGDNIVVELVVREEETLSGLTIVREKQERPPDVVVVGIGEKARRHFADEEGVIVEVGTTLITRKHEMIRLELADDGRELYVLKPAAALGTVDAVEQTF